MKTARSVLGVISIALYGAVISWLYTAKTGNAAVNNEEINGPANIAFAFLFLFAGIAGVSGRDCKKVSIITGVFYMSGGVIGGMNAGSFSDLKIWSILAFALGLFFVISGIAQKTGK